MIIYNYYFAILILALIFFFISNKNPSILIAIIIIIIIGYYYFNLIKDYNNNFLVTHENQIKTLEKDIDDNTTIYYLNNDKIMIELLFNIRFIKIFDANKFSTIIVLFEKLMKLYIFMLGDRYDIRIHFSTFIEVRKTIIKELYSSYLITPIKLKYIYNLNPFKEIKKTIEDFIRHTREMIIILEKYAYEKKGVHYLDDTKYKPFEDNNLEVY